jgi:hypothetical protein
VSSVFRFFKHRKCKLARGGQFAAQQCDDPLTMRSGEPL